MYQDILMKLSQQQHPGVGGPPRTPPTAANLIQNAGLLQNSPNIMHQVTFIYYVALRPQICDAHRLI